MVNCFCNGNQFCCWSNLILLLMSIAAHVGPMTMITTTMMALVGARVCVTKEPAICQSLLTPSSFLIDWVAEQPAPLWVRPLDSQAHHRTCYSSLPLSYQGHCPWACESALCRVRKCLSLWMTHKHEKQVQMAISCNRSGAQRLHLGGELALCV